MSFASRFPRLVTAAAILFFTLTTAWAAYNIWTSEYTLTKTELQDTLAKQFPRNVNYQSVFKVSIANPQLVLDEANNRITTIVDTKLSSPLLLPQDISGKIALNSGVKYDAPTRSLRLDQPVVSKVDVAGGSEQGNKQITGVADAVVRELLDDYAIYTFTPEQLELKGQRFEPGEITVGKNDIKVAVIQK